MVQWKLLKPTPCLQWPDRSGLAPDSLSHRQISSDGALIMFLWNFIQHTYTTLLSNCQEWGWHIIRQRATGDGFADLSSAMISSVQDFWFFLQRILQISYFLQRAFGALYCRFHSFSFSAVVFRCFLLYILQVFISCSRFSLFSAARFMIFHSLQ